MSILANAGTFLFQRGATPSLYRRGNEFSTSPLRRALLSVSFTAVFFIATSTGQAQQGYSASIGAAIHYVTENDSRSDCDGTTNSSSGGPIPGDVLSTLDLRPELKLFKYPSGEWKSASVTVYVPETPETGFTGGNAYTSTISSAGIVTTFTSGAISGNSISLIEETATDTSVETVDLNTGRYTWHRVINGSYPGGACPFTAIGKQDRTATLPISLFSSTTAALSLQLLNGAALQESPLPLSQSVKNVDAINAPVAAGLAADGASAAVIVFQSSSADPVTFTLSAPGLAGGIGGIAGYSPDYLVNPVPSAQIQYTDTGPINYAKCIANTGPNADNPPCIFVDLLYAPASMPNNLSSGSPPSPLTLSVQAVQNAADDSQDGSASSSIMLMPPPLVLVHGIWSNAEAWYPFESWIETNYPHQYIFAADYGATSSLSFTNSGTQQVLATTIANALTSAAQGGVVAQKVDVLAHSLGGLVTRYFMTNGTPAPFANSYLPVNPIHSLITVGTPQDGSPFASFLEAHQNDAAQTPPFTTLCVLTSNCTLGQFLTMFGKPIDTGVLSLETGIPSSSQSYRSIVGQANDPSITSNVLNGILNGYSSGFTVDGILGTPNDTIVPAQNQDIGAVDTATVSGIVHTPVVPLVPTDTGETASSGVWNQAVYWLLGLGTGQAPASGYFLGTGVGTNKTVKPETDPPTAPSAVFTLTGYTQVGASNVNFSPASGTALTIDAVATITATSTTKTISEILLYQTVTDPADTPVLYVTQSPFSIPFTPTRLGSANFTALAVFSDNTFTAVPLNYTLQPSGSALALSIQAPTANLPISLTTIVPAQAAFMNGFVNVTNVATYTAGSGGASVFSVGAGGAITATGNGEDVLNVSYGGVSASAEIFVGPCSYALSPGNQIVNYGGGSVSIQVTTQSGCAWTAASDSSWLKLSQATGSGSGTINAVAVANTTGSTQTAFVTIGDVDVALIQPATACTYTITPSLLNLPAAGGSGTLAVATTCPTTSSSDATWANLTTLSSTSVAYTVDPNTTSQSRSATLTIGTQQVSLVEAAAAANSTPTVMVTPSALSITTAQALMVTVAVSGGSGNPAPTGSVTLFSGSYTSAATTLSGGSATINIPAGSLATGSDTLTATYSPDSNSSSTYNSASGTSAVVTVTQAKTAPTVTVTPASSSVTTAQALSVTVAVGGTPTPTGTVTLSSGSYTSAATSLSSGSASINIPAGSLATGSDTLTVSYSGDSNYNQTTGTAPITVTTAVNPGITINGTAVSITPGAATGNTSTVTVTPTGGFTGNVLLTATVTSSPTGAQYPPTLSFGSTSPLSISGSSAGTATLTISTTAATSATLIYPKRPGFPWYRAGGATLACILLFGIPSRRSRWLTMLGMLTFLVALTGGVSACGGGGNGGGGSGGGGTSNPGTTAGVYTVTITGTSGTTSATGTVLLTVQ